MVIGRSLWKPVLAAATLWSAVVGSVADAAQIHVGAATISITPHEPVALSGQMHTRISKSVESPCVATVIALESREGDRSLDQAIMVSCDLVAIRDGVVEEVRDELKDKLEGLDLGKLFISATHTHTGPETVEGFYELPPTGVMRPSDYRIFLVKQIAEAVATAWKSRKPGSVGWGLGHAVIAQNRIAVFSDEKAQMYGKTDRPDFRRFEGYEDHGLEALFFWDSNGKLIATAINIACPSQEVEGRSAVNADFWHPVRETLKKRHGDDFHVLAWTGAGGDQSPHWMYRKQAEERMRRLRGLDPLAELARRIVAGWDEAYEGAQQERHPDATLVHKSQLIELPARMVTEEEVSEARSKVESLSKDPANRRIMQWQQRVVDRFEKQKPGKVHAFELHVLRLGDVAIATNPFELYTDYGVEMKARSPALQTFVIQLTGGGPTSYLPTKRATAGGAYGSIAQSAEVSSEGGLLLVERTVELINALWASGK